VTGVTFPGVLPTGKCCLEHRHSTARKRGQVWNYCSEIQRKDKNLINVEIFLTPIACSDLLSQLQFESETFIKNKFKPRVKKSYITGHKDVKVKAAKRASFRRKHTFSFFEKQSNK